MVDSLNDAVVECVKACGGAKQVAPLLWPEKTPEAAQRLLLDCMNEDRPAHLTPDALVFVLRLARSRGCHAGMEFLAASLGYGKPVPTDPKDEAAELQRQFLEATRTMAAMVSRMERLNAAAACSDFPTLRAA